MAVNHVSREGSCAEWLRLGKSSPQFRSVQADLQEGRSVFEEGNAFTLEALQHKVRALQMHTACMVSASPYMHMLANAQ